MGKLAGLSRPGKKRQAFQQWWHYEGGPAIEEAIEKRVTASVASLEDDGVGAEDMPVVNQAYRAQVAREVFASLPEEVRNSWERSAVEEATAKKAEYIKKLKGPLATTYEERAE